VIDHFEVGTERNGDGIHYLHVEGLFQEDSFCVDGLMRDLVLLECTKTLGDLGNQTSEFVGSEGSLLQGPHVDVISEGGLGVVPKSVDLLVLGAQVIFFKLLRS
jgi:hypothetical protein